MNASFKSKLVFLSFFSGYFLALWFLWDTPVIYPIKIFVVFLHEISHGMMALATGGRIDQIILDPNQGGACYCPGGEPFMTLTAGYLGSLIWGIFLAVAGKHKKIDARLLTMFLSIIVIALTMAYIHNFFGILFGLIFGLVLLFVAVEFSKSQNQKVQLILGLTSCLYAILDIKSDILDHPGLSSDATMLTNLTGVSVVFWGTLWITLALFSSFKLIFWLYRNP
ncbi:MAG TPA: M50 family peptidase [Gemmatimonadetes bacterium]|jgi:hypothetical protein|nr:M50 family peptidase [Gemmatimonadota bacterium]